MEGLDKSGMHFLCQFLLVMFLYPTLLLYQRLCQKCIKLDRRFRIGNKIIDG